jgi:ketosteroid isomerase-like protein
MSVEENRAVVQRIWKELIIAGNTERVDELIASDYVYHAPGDLELRGTEGFKELIAWLHTGFLDLDITLDDLVAEGDKVVSFYTVKATHESNKPLYYQGATASRLAGGKEVEAWEYYDLFAIALQLAPGWAKGLLHLIQKQMSRQGPGQPGGLA